MNFKGTEITVVKGDITEADTEAIVNAANNKFFMGGGVAGAIKRKGGKSIEDEAVKQGPVEIGGSVITSAGNLKSKYVIHASTMSLDFRTNEELIRKAAASALRLSQDKGISSISFCALGCGVGRFSYEDSAKIMAQEVFKYLHRESVPSLKKIVFVLYDSRFCGIFEKNVSSYINYLADKISKGPFLTVDGIVEYEGGIVLVERKNPPLGRAIPGGFVDTRESAEECVVREIKEETNLEFTGFKQFRTYSSPLRDPRFHTASVVFIGKGEGVISADSDAKSAKVFNLDSLPDKMAFDHRQILKDYTDTLSHRVGGAGLEEGGR